MQVSSFACCWRYRAGELSCRIVAHATDTLKNPSNLPQNRFSPLGWIVVPPEPRNALRRALKREIKILWILTHILTYPKTCLLPHQAQHRNKRNKRNMMFCGRSDKWLQLRPVRRKHAYACICEDRRLLWHNWTFCAPSLRLAPILYSINVKNLSLRFKNR